MDNTYEHEFDPVTPPEQEGFTAQPESSADPDPVYEAHTASQQPRAEYQPPYENPYYAPGTGTYYTPPKPPRPPKRKSGFWKFALVGLCCALIGALVAVGVYTVVEEGSDFYFDDSSIMLEGDRDSTVITQQVNTGELMTPAQVYAANVGSTVGITTSITTNYWGYQTTSAASGSGFIITDDGYIVTNFHVIEDSNAITVSMYDGSSYDAMLVGYDESNDLAVLKIDAEDLTPVVLGDSDNMNVGDSVIAIGNPLGELTFSLTSGAISALDRKVTFSGNITMDLLQTDCAINSGNSGGALFNLYGEVIGITNAKYSSSGGEASIDNIGFAIPMNDVKALITDIIEKGFISKPYIGVSVTDVSAQMQNYGLPQGAAVSEVTAGSPAEAGGLKVNDIITAVNDKPVTGSNDLVDIVKAASVDDELVVTVYRQGETIILSVIVGEQVKTVLPEDTESSAQEQQQGQYFPWGDFFGY